MVILMAVILPVIVFIFAIARPSHQTYSYVIANGTQASLDKGIGPANPLPNSLNVKVGDTIVVTNNDVVAHTYTFLVLRPGETGRYTFQRAGNFTATCTVSGHTDVTIVVT
jgi:plastocyanin